MLIFVKYLSDRSLMYRSWMTAICACRLQIESRLPHSEKLRQMVYQGVPHSIRSQIWMRTTGALEKKLKSEMSYKVIVKTSSNDHLMTSKQIEKVAVVSA